MDNLVSIYYGGTMERDRYGYVEFVDMQSVPVSFNEKPSFSEWLQGLGRNYIAMELMMMMASQWRVYFT
jgi:hypothetical protein